MQIEQLCVHSEPQSVPQELVDCCAAFSVEGNVIDNLATIMSKLSSVYTEVESSLNQIKEILVITASLCTSLIIFLELFDSLRVCGLVC